MGLLLIEIRHAAKQHADNKNRDNSSSGAILEAIAEKVRQYMIGCKAMRRLRLLGKIHIYTVRHAGISRVPELEPVS